METARSEWGKFLGKILLFAAPFLVLSALYVALDPFKTLHRYSDYYKDCHVEPNRDFVSTELYTQNAGRYGYDSFIFGSSRTLAFLTSDWTGHLPAGARPFHYDASTESLFGVWRKIVFLDSRQAPIRNVLWVADHYLLAKTDDYTQHLFIKHPSIAGSSWVRFQMAFFTAYFEKMFFIKYMDFRLFGVWRPYMGDVILPNALACRPDTNDSEKTPFDHFDGGLEDYYKAMAHVFYRRPEGGPPAAPRLLNESAVTMLQAIRRIFDKRGTTFKIVISPLYDQIRLHPKDLDTLRSIFGDENIHDFSGVNEITSESRNYYETSHFTIPVAREIMRRVYQSATEQGE